MKKFLPVTLAFLFLLSMDKMVGQASVSNPQHHKKYFLFAEGESDYCIAFDKDASESEQFAAKELQHWIKECGGVELPVKTIEEKHTGYRIVVGYNSYIKTKIGIEPPALNDESFTYCSSGGDILIYGGKQRGTMYGVFSFLERELGCRFYTPAVSIAPKRRKYAFSELSHSEKPGIAVRNDFYYEAFDPAWAARNKINGTLSDPRVQPGGVEVYLGVHTFQHFVPGKEFFDKHPEYFSLIDGKRVHNYRDLESQLCLTNPEVLNIVIERLKDTIRKYPDYLIFDVSQNDSWHTSENACFGQCMCDKCQAIVKKEGSESGPIIWFVNQVAESIEKEFPDKFIGTFAYGYSVNPPKNIRPHQNVVIRFCTYGCRSHSIGSCPYNQACMENLKVWGAIAPHLYIWDYVVSFGDYLCPYPNLNALQTNMKSFRDSHAIGVMEQGAYQSRGADFAELRMYLLSRLLWNPDCDVKDVIYDFTNGYYGRSGKFIRKYIDLLQAQIRPNSHITWVLNAQDSIFTDNFTLKAQALFVKAEKVADNQEILQRVELASLSVLNLKCRRMPVVSYYDGTYDKFCRIADREKVTYFNEGGGVKEFKDNMQNALEKEKLRKSDCPQ
jgi:hypothetical protein